MGLILNIIITILYLSLCGVVSYFLIVLGLYDKVEDELDWNPKNTLIIIGSILLIIFTLVFILLLIYFNRGAVAVKLSKTSIFRNKITKMLREKGYHITNDELNQIEDDDIAFCAKSIGVKNRKNNKCVERIKNNYSHLIKPLKKTRRRY